MAIKLTTKIFNTIRQVQKSGLFTGHDMRNVATVVSYLRTVKEDEAAEWIEKHEIEYLTGLLQGFEVDNSQASQLREIHTKEATEMEKLTSAYTK